MAESPRQARSVVVRIAAVALAACLGTACPEANGLIDPGFTPVHLVKQSAQVLWIELANAAGGGIAVRLVKRLKGKAPSKAPALDLTKGPKPQAEALRRTLGDGKKPALLFLGQYGEKTPDGQMADAEPQGAGTTALLHVEGNWFRLFQPKPGAGWLLEKVDESMEGTWAGGTDMLLRAVDYILTDPRPVVPTRTWASWAEKVKVADVAGTVHGAAVVDLSADGAEPPSLHLLCEAGDQILQWDPKTRALADRTAALKLTARSLRAAWADFNADGTADLASWDGKSVTVHLRGADGRFAGRPRTVEAPAGCIGLSVLNAGTGDRPAILVSTANVALLLVPGPEGRFIGRPVADVAPGTSPARALGRPLPCMVADFDGDDVADILQPFARGALFYQGGRPGTFGVPRRCGELAGGKGRAGACLGDYDADGLLDVFIAAEEGCFLWHNVGGGRFVEALHLAGEAAYITKPGGIASQTCDVNGDGRQDVLVLYANRSPQVFFNRGFRSFGHSHWLDLAERGLLAQGEDGQQAGAIGDLDGDGGQDMVVVSASGEVWVFFRETAGGTAPSLRVALPADGRRTGPVRVIGWHGKRCLGAWNVARPAPEAFLARRTKGPLTVQWPAGGAEPRRKRVIVLRPTWLTLPKTAPPDPASRQGATKSLITDPATRPE